MDDLLELRDQDLAKDIQEANWFSAPSALRVYGMPIITYQLMKKFMGIVGFLGEVQWSIIKIEKIFLF